MPYSKYGRKPRNECWRHSRRSIYAKMKSAATPTKMPTRIKDINSSHGAEEMRQLVELTEQVFHQHPTIAKMFPKPDSITPSVPRVRTTNPNCTQSVPRVQGTAPAQRQTQLMSQSLELATQQIARAFSRTTETPTSTSPTEETQITQRGGCTINSKGNHPCHKHEIQNQRSHRSRRPTSHKNVCEHKEVV